jgi:hypothetical protein
LERAVFIVLMLLILILIEFNDHREDHDQEQDHEQESTSTRDDRLALPRRNVAYIFQSAREKTPARHRDVRSHGEAEVFRSSAMTCGKCGEIKYDGAVHFPFRRPGALI